MPYTRLLLFFSTLLWGFASLGIAQTRFLNQFPHYEGEVQFSLSSKTLEGRLRVLLPPTARQEEVLFALPMNRFTEPDARGLRRPKETPIFAKNSFSDNDDPLLPNGFQPGNLEILRVREGDQELAFQLEDNPQLEVGFSPTRGLLRIQTSGTAKEVEITFRTQFPERYLEGVVDGVLITSQWYPELLLPQEGNWDTSMDQSSPATFQIEWSAVEAGQLISTTYAGPSSANQPITLPATSRPVRTFPLIFGTDYSQHGDGFHLVESFHRGEYTRRVGLLHQWSDEFFTFVQQKYGLLPRWDQLRVVQVPGRSEEVTVFNNLILVPQPHYERSEMLDRRVVGLVTMRLGQIWFGETIWNNEDTQMWLSRGLPVFLSLRFYEQRFGRDAGIFDFINWMNPQFREHFIEEMAREGKKELQKPIVYSFRDNPATKDHLRAVNYKAATVLSMLEYVIGDEAFRRGLQHFSQAGRYQRQTAEDLRSSMELASGEDLEWFFSQWFETTEQLDYALGELQYDQLPSGDYLVRIEVRKLEDASMPLEVLLRTEDGQEYRQKIFSRRPLYIVQFRTQSPPDAISLDPDEHLLETSRVNNHSFTFLRIRFAFDWKRQRERLITFVPGITNNPVDGNSFGIGLRHREGDTEIYAIPGYGTRSEDVLYQLDLRQNNLLRPNYFGQLLLERVGGIITNGAFFGYDGPRYPDRRFFMVKAGLALEYLYSSAASPSSDSGNSNAITLEFDGWNRSQGPYRVRLQSLTEQPSQELETDYSYTLQEERLTQVFETGFRSNLSWQLILGNTLGHSPEQKKFSLGGPLSLRGFPQAAALQQENYLLSRLDYEFPLVTSPWWGNVSSLGLQGKIFFDQGRAWGNGGDWSGAQDRRNVGFGIRWGVDAASLIQLPLQFEIAYPVGDSEYKSPQFIFFGILTGS